MWQLTTSTSTSTSFCSFQTLSSISCILIHCRWIQKLIDHCWINVYSEVPFSPQRCIPYGVYYCSWIMAENSPYWCQTSKYNLIEISADLPPIKHEYGAYLYAFKYSGNDPNPRGSWCRRYNAMANAQSVLSMQLRTKFLMEFLGSTVSSWQTNNA